MITPKFSCSQTETSVVVQLYTPAIRASDIEIHVEDHLFSVHVNPYFLRLHLPGAVTEDDNSSARYDPGVGYLTVKLTKVHPGEDFKDLDILSSLLAPPKADASEAHPVIEVLGEDEEHTTEESLSKDEQEILQAAENDWHFPQQQSYVSESNASILTSMKQHYGFLSMYTGYFAHISHTENEINELGVDVENLTPYERRQRRTERENEKWDEDYYMADFADDEWIMELIAYEFPARSPLATGADSPIVFTEEENHVMLRLPSKEYLTSPSQTHDLYLTLVTLLFAYSYDARTTQNDPTPESAWTICSLTPAFAALDPPPYPSNSPTISPSHEVGFSSSELVATLLPSVRRALSFPLHRHFALAMRCVRDVSSLLCHGKRSILRALLEMKDILERHEVYYIYCKIWVDDFCSWVSRSANDDVLKEIAQMLLDLEIDKSLIGWDIPALEDATRHQLQREPDSDDEDDSVDEANLDVESHPPSSSSSSSSRSSSSLSSVSTSSVASSS